MAPTERPRDPRSEADEPGSTPPAVLHVDDAGTVRAASEAVTPLTGYEPGALIGESVPDLLVAGEAPAALDPGPSSGQRVVETTLRRADGETRPVRLTVDGIDGAGVSRVVTVEPAPRDDGAVHSRRELARMSDAFFALDEDWRFTYLNERGREVVAAAGGPDRDPDSLRGRVIWDVVPEAIDTVFYREYHAAMDEQTPRSFEAEYAPLSAWFDVNVYPDEDGISVFFREITERKERELRRETYRETLSAVYDVAGDADRQLDEKIERALDLGSEFLGLPYGFETRIDEGVQEIRVARGDHRLLQPGEQCSLSESYCRKTIEGEGFLAVVEAAEEGWADDPAYDTFDLGAYVGAEVRVEGERTGTVCFAATEPRDRPFSDLERTFVELLAEWVGYERERERAHRRLRGQSERMAELASIVSHDLRNPLSAAISNLERAETGDDPHLRRVERAHRRMDELTADLLSLTREDDVEGTVVAPADVAEAAWASVDPDEATLSVDVEGRVSADGVRLQTLFETLFRNCVTHGDAPAVAVRDTDEGFAVTDDGPVVPPEDRERVFDPAFGGPRAGKGVGLTVAERVAASHDWRLSVTESDRGGTRFDVRGVSFVGEE